MIDGKFVFNAVSHAYALSDENTQDNKYARAVRDTLASPHRDMQPGVGLGEIEQRTGWQIEVLARTLFLETDVDMAATHTPCVSTRVSRTGFAHVRRLSRQCAAGPTRFVAYVGVDPTGSVPEHLRLVRDGKRPDDGPSRRLLRPSG